MSSNSDLNKFSDYLKGKYPHQHQYLQAVKEVAEDIHQHALETDNPSLFENMWYLAEPDRVIEFKVCWEDDDNIIRFNTGFRVQHSNALGPYKGGLRFVKDLQLDTLRFLAFEQSFKNALTSLPMGGAKGGSDFDPHGKSNNEIRRFCHAFMSELSRYVGMDADIPAGDIGVGSQEIAYMFYQYKQITGSFAGVLTGRDPLVGGSLFREEATGYGTVYFAKCALAHQDDEIDNKSCTISGAGNVALHTAEKLLALKAKVLTLSDSKGTCYFKDGLDEEQLHEIKRLKKNRGHLHEIRDNSGVEYHEGKKPWAIEADLGFACATQNEIDIDDAKAIEKGGYQFLFEGANMPCDEEANTFLRESDVIVAPSKAVNAGGVAVSGLEISQSRSRLPWERDHVEEKLHSIMNNIHSSCVTLGQREGKIDYSLGANLASYQKLCKAMTLYGLNGSYPSYSEE